MLNTFKLLWEVSKNRHTNLIKALVLSFLRSTVTVTEFLSVITAVNVLCGEITPRDGMIKIIIFALICVFGNFITSYFEQINTLSSGFFMVADKRVDVGNTLRKIPLGYFNENSSGKISATLTTTLSGVESAAAMVIIGIVSGLFSSFCLFLFMMYYDYSIGILTGIGMVLYLILVNYQMKLSRKNAPALQTAQSELAEATLTFLQGIKVTKAFSFHAGDRRMKEAIKRSCVENIGLTKKSMPTQYAGSISIAIAESIILFASLYLCLQGGNVDIVKIIVLIIFSFVVYMSLNQAGSMLSMIGLLDTGLLEVKKIEDVPEMNQEMPEEHAKSNDIEIKDLSFSYGENEVLHNISTKIPENSLTAVIGPSGSGKTTLCQMIPRFRDADSGKITIGGADIKHMSSKELMSKISMVFQNVYLFEDTIFNNIAFGKPDATMDEVRSAAKDANCDEFIMNLPDGYNTILQEGGNSLSGGEKQRISIARAMLKDAPIIILDEATSALDAENEQEILSAIDKLTANKTVIMIAHRLKTVQNADKIIALKDGVIVQEGTHEELKDVPGLYADFLATRLEASSWEIKL